MQARHTVMLLLVIPELANVSHHQKRRFYQPFSTWFLERVKPHCPKPSSGKWRKQEFQSASMFCGPAEEPWLRKATTHLLIQPYNHPVKEEYEDEERPSSESTSNSSKTSGTVVVEPNFESKSVFLQKHKW